MAGMGEAALLLRAYWERLHEELVANRSVLEGRVDKLLKQEAARESKGGFDDEKYEAYRDACVAFLEERIEAYNPIGIQYTFERAVRKRAGELELELDWYEAKGEYEELLTAARVRAEVGMSDERLRELAEELIRELGAYPDRSIISGYEGRPALRKLPDYVAARAIEEIVR